jgi:hypothetical protein
MKREVPRKHDFGGSSLGSSFFGWLVATGMSVVLAALAIAVSTALGLGLVRTDLTAAGNVQGLPAAIAMLCILAVSYLAGGYVAGRLARFRGVRAGFGVWAIAGLLTILTAGLGTVIGSQFDLFAEIELPRLTLGADSIALGGALMLVVSSALTLATSLLGGRLGERYHVRIDEQIGGPTR